MKRIKTPAGDIIVNDEEAQQLEDFEREVREGGWTIYKPEEWEKIQARYRADRDIADSVPRSLIYWDIAMLVGHIMNLEQELALAKRLIPKQKKSAPSDSGKPSRDTK